eukprot:g14364.t1
MVHLARQNWHGAQGYQYCLPDLQLAAGQCDPAAKGLRQILSKAEEMLRVLDDDGSKERRKALLEANTTRAKLSVVLEKMGKYDDAGLLLERSLAFSIKGLGPEHPDVATVLNNRAAVLRMQGKYEEAGPLHERSLATREKALGPDHPEVATALNNRAVSVESTYALFKRTQEIFEKSLGQDHPNVSTILNNRAGMLKSVEKYEEADSLYKRSLAIDEKVYGPDHPQVATDLNNWAELWAAQGKLEEALEVKRKGLAIEERVLSPNHPQMSASLNNLAGLSYKQTPLYLRAIEIGEKALGPDHLDLAAMLSNRAVVLEVQGKHNEAAPLLERAYSICRRTRTRRTGVTDGQRATATPTHALRLMVTTRQQTSAPNRGRATSSRGRAHSRSASRSVSRSASRSTPQRPRASRGRGAQHGSTRGGRRRGASSRPDNGDGDLPAGVEELRRMVLEIRGQNLQLQQEMADMRAQEDPGEAADHAGPADPAAHPDMEEPDEREEQEVIVTDMPPPPPRERGTPSVTSREVRLFLMKEDVRSWTNPAHAKRWLITGTRPVNMALTEESMKSMMHDTVQVTQTVYKMLNNLGGFDVREFFAPNDDRDVPDRLLTENVAIFNRAVVRLLSKGVCSNVGRARVAILQQGLQSGLHLLERHCNEYRRQMRVPENADIMADHVNKDLNMWAGQLFDTATDLTARFPSPPTADELPPIIIPTWTRLSGYIAAGGLLHSPHQPPRAKSVPPGGGRGKAPAASRSGRKGYCYAWASPEGCPRSASECWWEHAHDPNPTGKGKKGGRWNNRRGGNNSGGGSSGGRQSGATRRDAEDRGSAIANTGGGGSGGGGGGGSSGGGPART